MEQPEKTIPRSNADRVWGPVKEHVGAARVVLLSFDGLLSKVSFAAFPNDEGGYLVDDREIVSVSAPRLLIRTRVGNAASKSPVVDSKYEKLLLLVGGVDYNSRSSKLNDLTPSTNLVAAHSAETATSGNGCHLAIGPRFVFP